MTGAAARPKEAVSTSGRLFEEASAPKTGVPYEANGLAHPVPAGSHFWSFADPGRGHRQAADTGQQSTLGGTGQISLAQAAFDEDRPESLRKRAWSLRDSQKALNKDFLSPGKSANLLNTVSRDGSVTSRRTGSFVERKPYPSEVTSGWLEHSILDSRNDMNIMQSMAVVPSEVGIPSQLMTGFSFTEMPAQSSILNSRNSIDADHRAIKELYGADKAGGAYESCLDTRKGAVEDSAREVENQSDLLPHKRHNTKTSKGDLEARRVPGSAHKHSLGERQAAVHAEKHRSLRNKQLSGKSQGEAVGGKPARPGPHKRHPALFTRQPGQGSLHKHPTWYSLPINRLDARSEKAMSSHDRIMAWLEQGERYMVGLHPVSQASPKAPVETAASFATSHSKAAVKPAKGKDGEPNSGWCCRLPCFAV